MTNTLDVGADYLMKLDARNLIQVNKRGHDGKVKKFRIHDLLHSVCVNMGRELDFLNTIDHLEPSSAKAVRQLAGHQHSIAGKEELIYQMTKLRGLFHVHFVGEIEMKRLNNMLGRFQLLQMLILELGLSMAEEVHILTQIGNLSRLNYLSIQSHCFVKIPWSIRNIKNLQTLDLLGCAIAELPIGIWKMEQLRHLLLGNIYQFDSYPMRLLCQCQQVQVSLPNLQTLFWSNCSDLTPDWLLKFTNLRELELWEVTPEIVEVLLCGPDPISRKLESLTCRSFGRTPIRKVLSLAKYERLMELKIRYVQLQMQQPLELPASLISLTLQDTQLTEDPMKILKHLHKLKFLELKYNAYLGSKMDCSGADSFPQLEVLEISNLEELEELIVHEGEEMGMPMLRQVTIWVCPRLVRIPERLQQLRS